MTFALPAAQIAGTALRRAVTERRRSAGGAKSRFNRSLTANPATAAYRIGLFSQGFRVSRSSSSDRISPSRAAASIWLSKESFARSRAVEAAELRLQRRDATRRSRRAKGRASSSRTRGAPPRCPRSGGRRTGRRSSRPRTSRRPGPRPSRRRQEPAREGVRKPRGRRWRKAVSSWARRLARGRSLVGRRPACFDQQAPIGPDPDAPYGINCTCRMNAWSLAAGRPARWRWVRV